MTNKCNQCKKYTATMEGIKCNKCNAFYHRACTADGADGGAARRWLCGACRAPVGPGKPAEPEPTDDAAADAGDARLPASLAREIKLLRASVTREMGSMRLELSRLNTIVADFGSRVDGLEERLDDLEHSARAKAAPDEPADVAEIVAQLRAELNDREQDTLLNDVEIAGLEERPGENLIDIVLLVAKKIDAALEERDVVSAERRGPQRVAAEGARPRPVTVRLARRAARDGLLRAARTRRGADSAGVVGGEPRRLYVNERLTAANRHLLYRARQAARRAGWRFVWSRGGRVFARRGERGPVRRVRSLDDVRALFGDDAAPPPV